VAPDEESVQLAAHRARVRVDEWFRAIEMQHRRALGPTLGTPGVDVTEEVYREEWHRRQRDVVFYVFALDLFWQAVTIAQKTVPGAETALGPALQAFKDAVPSRRDLRNAIAHFDKFDFGEGNRPPVDNPAAWSYF
jgi:hypothetical protein